MEVFHAPGSGMAGQPTSAELTEIVLGAAVYAPSVHNTQPWQFAISDREISVFADPSRSLRVADPRGRELMISCGAAVLTIRVALRQLGYVPTAAILPDPGDPKLVAQVSWDEAVPPVDYEQRIYAQIEQRRSHRGSFDPDPLPTPVVSALCEEAALEGAILRVMAAGGENAALAATIEAAEQVLRMDNPRRQEQARWATEPGSHRLDGVPASAYPARAEHTEPYFPSRDFAVGRGWGVPVSGDVSLMRSAGLVCVLATATDEATDWVRAGQALQRTLLCASASGVATALHSQPLEFPGLREFIRAELSGRAHPQLILRFGVTGARPVTAVRRPVRDVLI